MSIVDWLDRRLYPGIPDGWDDLAFRDVIASHLGASRGSHVLDLGAGAGVVEAMNFLDLADRVCGVDPDPRVLQNPFLHEGKVGFGESIPYGDESFDLVFADNVLEHLPDPRRVFKEVHRVLRPGGLFLAKTPNRWHYVPIIATLTPHRFHEWVNEIRGRDAEDTFPTLYRANTARRIRDLATETGFTGAEIRRIEGRPEYTRISAPTYLLGALWERAVNATSLLAPVRVLLIATLRKGPSL